MFDIEQQQTTAYAACRGNPREDVHASCAQTFGSVGRHQ